VILQALQNSWNSTHPWAKTFLKWLGGIIGGSILTYALYYIVNSAAAQVIKNNIKEPWFAEEAIKQLGNSVVGSYVYDSFYMGREEDKKEGIKKDPTEHSIRIYASKNQDVILYLRELQYKTGKSDKPRKIEILVNGKPIANAHRFKVAENVQKVPLTESVAEARSRTEYEFERNMIVVSFRNPEQLTTNYVSLEAHILTIGSPKLPEVGDEK
jgi:hypothetical protein